MSDQADPQDKQDDERDDEQGGQVSEVGNMSEASEPISDSQSVAGSPSQESGQVDEGPTGPNSRAGSNQN